MTMINGKYIFTSMTRISDLREGDFEISPLTRSHWATGDYIAARVTRPSLRARIELYNGRMMDPMRGENIIGALGIRHATLEATGTWKIVESDMRMHVLTGAGLMGKVTSHSILTPVPIQVAYLGHVVRERKKQNMKDFVDLLPPQKMNTPVVLMAGTSMSAGKTTVGRIVTKKLKELGLKVVGVKMTGAARFRDVLSLRDAGADHILDFVDVGLPSTICQKATYQKAIEQLLARIAALEADVAVVEIGASPLEPYNGKWAYEKIRKQVRCRILCATDPYAVLGLMQCFKFKPDLVSGPVANTLAGAELVQKLCGIEALNLLHPPNRPALKNLLIQKLGLQTHA